MGMVGLRFVLPELAEKETRSIIVGKRNQTEDQYILDEMYCVEPGCDCRRALFAVLSIKRGAQVATISHALPGGELENGERSFLDPINVQSKDSKALLKLFKEEALTLAYEKRLQEHYRLFKEAVADPTHPCQKTLQEAGVKANRNAKPVAEPYAHCPCGSHKKYRFCCGAPASRSGRV